MLGKIWSIFLRDAKVNIRDYMALMLILIPAGFAIGIQLLAPSVNDTTVRLAMLSSDNPDKISYLEQFARVELFEDLDALTARIERRDNIVGILPEGGSSYLLAQGNEPEGVTAYAKALNAFHDLNLDVTQTTASFESFGRTEPPLKKMLVNITLLLTTIMSGMLVGINIVEEKMDKTISAINVTPISRTGFVLGKNLMGIVVTVYGCAVVLLITGYTRVDIGQTLLAVLSAAMISLLVGFISGLASDDVMNTAASIKMLALPLGASIAAAELLADKWQILFYWLPFYWSYRANDAILSYTATWPQILGYTAIVLLISVIVYVILAPRIREGLA